MRVKVKPLSSLKLFFWIYRLGTSTRIRLTRRFTPAGLAVVCILVIMALMGPDTENNVAYQAVMPLLSVLFLAVLWSLFFRARFETVRRLPRFGTVGQPFRYKVSIRNLTGRKQSGLWLAEELSDPKILFEDWIAGHIANERRNPSFRISKRQPIRRPPPTAAKRAPIPTILPGQEIEVTLEATPQRRGLLSFDAIRISRPDPMGLVCAVFKARVPQTTLVLPKRYGIGPIAMPGSAKYQEGGVAMASSVGQSEEFVALRDYRRGDPLRHIHWRSWAKAGKPVVKEYEDEFFMRHALILDTFLGYESEELFEEAVSVAASFACTVRTQESLLDLLFVGAQSYCFTAGRGLAHADQMLEVLASVRPCREHKFSDLEHLILEHSATVSGCICVLLGWDKARQELVRKLRSLGMPTLVFLLVDQGKAGQIQPGPMAEDPENFRVLELGKVEQALAGATN